MANAIIRRKIRKLQAAKLQVELKKQEAAPVPVVEEKKETVIEAPVVETLPVEPVVTEESTKPVYKKKKTSSTLTE